MSITAEILAHSIAPHGVPLITIAIRYPRLIQAQLNTHRMLSKNASSSRAIPVKKLIQYAQTDPYVPYFAENQSGMSPGPALEMEEQEAAEKSWLRARDRAVEEAKELASLGVHKQWANRLLEPFLWQAAIISGTDWKNFFRQRLGEDTQDEFQALARTMNEAIQNSTPRPLTVGTWHLPLITDEDRVLGGPLPQISAARCARISYRRRESRSTDDDLALYKKLVESIHLSPLEHVAQATDNDRHIGNFRGWKQLRKTVVNESGENE